MKMKKTQSLKLMLLGLLIGFGSVGAFAADFFTSGGFVFEKVTGGVKVAGVTQLSTSGIVTIGTQVTDSQDPDGGTYQVVAIDDDWYNRGELKWTDSENVPHSANTIDLRTKKFVLKIDAANLTSISTAALRPLNGSITQFIVTTNAGLKGIPAYAFANVSTKMVDNTQSAQYKELEQQIKDYENLLATQSLEDQPAIKDGKYQGNEYKDAQVYHVLVNKNGADVSAYGVYAIVGQEDGIAADGTSKAYHLLQIKPDGSLSELANPMKVRYSTMPGETRLIGQDIETTSNPNKEFYVATPVAEDYTSAAPNAVLTIKGLNTLASEAKTKYEELKGLCNTLSSDQVYLGLLDNQQAAGNLVTKLAALKAMFDEVRDAWTDAGYEVTAAVAAGSDATLTNDFQKAAYAAIMPAMLEAGFPNLKHPKAGASQMTTTGGRKVYEPTIALRQLYDIPSGALLFIGESGKFNWIKPVVIENGKLKVNNDDCQAIVNPNGSAVNPTADDANGTLKLNGEIIATPYYAEGTYDLKGFAKPSFETVNSAYSAALNAKTAADEVIDNYVAYTDEEGETYNKAELGGDDCTGGLIAEALQAWNDAKQDIKDYNEAAGAKIDDMKADLDSKKEIEVPETDPSKFYDNEVLTKVQIDNGKIETFGEACFVNCIGVKTADWTAGTSSFRFPASTKTIGAYAFRNTHINAKLGGCATTIQKIGDYAFEGTETEYVNLNDATQLTDVDEDGNPLEGDKIMIGKGVWNNTPLIEIGLKNTELKSMPDGLAQNIRRIKDYEIDGCDGELKVDANTTLTSVKLPYGLTKFADNQFIWCINLASIGTVPATVTSIGASAFQGTIIPKFDLTALKDLDYVGDKAFANNAALLSVEFAAEAPFTNLYGSTFACDNNLNEVVINDDLECLPAGIFKGSKVASLDLSKTQITVLNDLFQAEATGDLENTTLVELTLPETLLDKDNFTVLRPGLKVIADKALSQLKALKGTKQADGSYRMIIPSSVELMGSYVFQNDKALENVDFIDSKLVNLGEGTFNSCDKLKEVKFLTINRIERTVGTLDGLPKVDDLNDCGEPEYTISTGNKYGFVEGMIFGPAASRDPKTLVYVTKESYDLLKPDGGINNPQYEEQITTLKVFEQTIPLIGPNKINGVDNWVATYYNSNYGTWIPTDKEKQDGANVKVWTAYQDGDFIYAYQAKHNNKFYKIPAAGDPKDSKYYPKESATSGARMAESEDVKIPVIASGSYDYYDMPDESNMEAFAKQTTDGTFVFQKIQYYAPGSAAVIITSDKNQPVKFEQRSTKNTKYQSTLDWKNELKVAGIPFATTDDDNVYKFSGVGGNWVFYQDVRDPIPAKKIVFPMSSYQGTAYPELTRDIIFLDGEFTSIDEVKQYVKAMKESGEIYNLRGMKVTTPVKGQMYIQNGKKFIQK